MSEVRILVLGYFGWESGKRDGQAVKTRQCLELLKRNSDERFLIRSFDTEILHTKPWRIVGLLLKIIHSNKVVYLPAQNNLYYFFPFLHVLSKFFRFDIVYLLIGGWLPLFLEKHKCFIKRLKHIKAILPENTSLTNLLKEKYGFENVYTAPNFRFVESVPQEQTPSPNKEMFRLVFLSRITKTKGLDTMFAIARHFSKPEIREKYPVSIDFYGEIDHQDRTWFNQMLNQENNVCYKGILEPEEITRVLSAYDALILPTRYPGEGVPGAIIDAYMAGIPVLVSDWRYIRDVVEHGKTGYLVSLDQEEVETYIRHIEYLSSHPQELSNMKLAAYEQSRMYDEKAAWAVLKPFLS